MIWGFINISTAVSGAMEPTCLKYGFMHYKLIAHWEEIVGSKISAKATPITLKFNHKQYSTTKKAVLLLGVKNPAFILELRTLEKTIKEKVSNYLGYNAIDYIKIKILK